MRLAHNGLAPAFHAGFSGFDSHQPLLMEKTELEELLIAHLNVEKELKKVFFGGFDNYKDYLLYGYLFEQLGLYEKSLD